jgi:hypothetical protein
VKASLAKPSESNPRDRPAANRAAAASSSSQSHNLALAEASAKECRCGHEHPGRTDVSVAAQVAVMDVLLQLVNECRFSMYLKLAYSFALRVYHNYACREHTVIVTLWPVFPIAQPLPDERIRCWCASLGLANPQCESWVR